MEDNQYDEGNDMRLRLKILVYCLRIASSRNIGVHGIISLYRLVMNGRRIGW